MKKVGTYFTVAILIFSSACTRPSNQVTRKTTSLNGTWQIAEVADSDTIPATFNNRIVVPGFVDMAFVPFNNPGLATGVPRYYWYRKTFTLDENSEICLLRLHKAKYSTKILLNGKEAGCNNYCFSPFTVNISPYLKKNGEQNELLIRVGTWHTLPDTIPYGKDGEKFHYMPGIYDDVELIQSCYPYVQELQIAPDLRNKKIRVKAVVLTNQAAGQLKVTYSIQEKSGGRVFTDGIAPDVPVSGNMCLLDFIVEMHDAIPWSPELPFLYTFTLNTGADSYSVNFGMRTFALNPDKGMAVLNGTDRYLRGTNLAVLRFEEDSSRSDLLWKRQWVTDLHKKFKNSGMNIIRYSIGFPPDFWYDITDSLGLLVQDEYPIWTGITDKKDSIRNQANVLTEEFKRWMKQRWNHPSLVIWDANNESLLSSTGAALSAVRHLDLSGRPWDNGWGIPQDPNDAIESHPYFFIRFWRIYKLLNGPYEPSDKGFYFDFFSGDGNPLHPTNLWNTPFAENKPWPNAVINNEYEWIWLMRDGTPSTIDSSVYEIACKNCNKTEKFELLARTLAIATEYWRCNRKCAAVMYFTGLTYSRSHYLPSSTSDNFIDPKTLEFEPSFEKYVVPAFQPVGLMIARWEKTYTKGSCIEVPVVAINDLLSDWSGNIELSLYSGSKKLSSQLINTNIRSMGKTVNNFYLTLPSEAGEYRIEASTDCENKKVISIRSIQVK